MKLSEAEWEVMEQIWQMEPPVTSVELSLHLKEKGWKATTLLTFLARMVAKGLLQVEKKGKQNYYTPTMDRDAYRATEVKEVLDKLYSGSVKHMVAALYQKENISQQELDELQSWLEKR